MNFKFKILSNILLFTASIVATASQIQCIFWFLDEPEMPRSLIENKKIWNSYLFYIFVPIPTPIGIPTKYHIVINVIQNKLIIIKEGNINL